MVAELVKKGMLDSEHYLVKDGSLEYRPTKDIIADKRKSIKIIIIMFLAYLKISILKYVGMSMENPILDT